jgi:hypothetical protein
MELTLKVVVDVGDELIDAKKKYHLRRTIKRGIELEGYHLSRIMIGEEVYY